MIPFDPGHGGSERGAVVRGVYESNLNLETCQRAVQPGEVGCLTRYTDADTSWAQRQKMVKDAGGRGVVNVHYNTNRDPSVHGASAFYWPGNDLTAEVCRYLMSMMPAAVATRNIFEAHDRGWLRRPRRVLAAFEEPAALLEVCFLTNPDDFKLATNTVFRAKVAQALRETAIHFDQLVKERTK